MRTIVRGSQGASVCFFVTLLFAAVSFCHGKDSVAVEVVGTGECVDCALQNNFKTSQAYSGLRVTIDCKSKNGEFKTRGTSSLDEQGNFKVSLPEEIVDQDGKLKEECYAQLHSASSTPCPAYDGSLLESSKIINLKTKTNQKHTLGLPNNKKLKFSPITCASAFFWPPHMKYPPLPKFKLPPLKSFGHHHPFTFPPFPPKSKIFPPPIPKVLPPLVPIHKPKPHVPKLLPPKTHVPKVLPSPKPPVIKKPCSPLIPKVLPPPVSVYNPKPPVTTVLPPPVPIYKPKPPIFIKPIPPFPKIPPLIPKKSCPPLPKLPPIPKIPPKYFHHPKFGKWPPMPPLFPSHP